MKMNGKNMEDVIKLLKKDNKIIYNFINKRGLNGTRYKFN